MSSAASLVFDIFAKDHDTEKVFKGIEGNASKIGDAVKLAAGAGIGLAVADMAKAAGDFQEKMTSLVTGAGETKENLGKVSDGILQLARDTGTSTDQLASGMYLVESAGYHGAEGLDVLKAAAQGAKVGNADLATVADAVTSSLNSYHMKASDATAMTNEMVATVASGKMHMQDLAGSLSAVLPTASAVGISFAQVGGAVATMTGKGMSAQQATQDLANTIRALSAPSQVATQEMEQLGINSVDVAQNLGQRGLTGTLDVLTKAITDKMGPSGLVIMDAFKKSQSAAEDAKTMFDKLPESIKGTAQAFMDGKITTAEWRAAIKGMPVDQAELAKQFAATEHQAKGFNDILKSGSPEAQTFTASLSKLLGGATGLNVGLMLTGDSAATFKDNVKSIGDAAKGAGGDVTGWAEVQEDFNTKLAKAKETFETTKITIGNALLPVLIELMDKVSEFLKPIVEWVSHNKEAAAGLVGIGLAIVGLIAAISAIRSAVAAFIGVQAALNAVMAANPIMLIVIAIAALVAGVIWAYNNVGWFKDGVDAAFKFIGDVIRNVVDWVVNNLGPVFKAVFDGIVVYLHIFVAVWTAVVQTIINIAQGIIVGFNSVVAWFGQVGQFFAGIWNAIVAGVQWLANMFILGWNSIVQFLRPVIAVFQSMFGAIGALIGFLVKLWTFGFQTMMWATQQIANFVVSVWNNVASFFKTIFTAISDFIVTVWNNVASFFTTVFTTIGNFIVTAWNGYVGFISGPLSAIWDFIVSIWNNVSGFVSGVLGTIGRFISDGFNSYVSFASSILSGLYSAVTGAWQTVSDWAGGIAGQVLGWFAGAGKWLWDAGVNIINGFLGGLKSMWDNVAGFFKSLTDMIPNTKGPIERDRNLLVPAGLAIMGGFHGALKSQFGTIRDSLSGFTDSLTPDIGAGIGGAAAFSSSAPAIYVQNPFTGEYLLAKMDSRASNAIDNASYRAGTRPSR